MLIKRNDVKRRRNEGFVVFRVLCQSDTPNQNTKSQSTRPSALGMSYPIWGPLIYIFVDGKKN